MIVQFTLGNVAVLLIALVACLFIYNGFRGLFLDEIVIGGILLVIAWYITTLGPVL